MPHLQPRSVRIAEHGKVVRREAVSRHVLPVLNPRRPTRVMILPLPVRRHNKLRIRPPIHLQPRSQIRQHIHIPNLPSLGHRRPYMHKPLLDHAPSQPLKLLRSNAGEQKQRIRRLAILRCHLHQTQRLRHRQHVNSPHNLPPLRLHLLPRTHLENLLPHGIIKSRLKRPSQIGTTPTRAPDAVQPLRQLLRSQ